LVYGAEFNEDFLIRHKKAKNKVERDKFRGSKYVQSDMNDVFVQIAENLRNNKKVLFTGTPCQVAGLRRYLDINIKENIENNIIFNDIICHGTSSPKLWKNYIEFIQKKSKLKSYTSRSKEIGWHGYNARAEFEDSTCETMTDELMIYAYIYGSDLALRPSCYKCKYSSLNRHSDVTIGDFWGIEKAIPHFEDNGGVSLGILNSHKGIKLFKEIKNAVYYEESNTVDCLQHNLKEPTKLPINREKFWNDYQKYGFTYISKKYANYNLKYRIKRNMIIILKKTGLYAPIINIIRR